MDGFDRLELAMERAGLTRKAVAMEVGFNVGNFASWKARRDLPRPEVLIPVCRLCGVSAEWMVTGADSTDPWIRENRRLIEELKLLSPEQRQAVDATVHTFAEIQRSKLGEGSASGGAS